MSLLNFYFHEMANFATICGHAFAGQSKCETSRAHNNYFQVLMISKKCMFYHFIALSEKASYESVPNTQCTCSRDMDTEADRLVGDGKLSSNLSIVLTFNNF